MSWDGAGSDEINAAILRELKANARLPLATLGRRVGLSRTAVKQRLERLERSGQIRGYTTVVPGDKPAPDPVTAILLVERTDRLHGAGVIGRLRSIPEVGACHVLSGDLDVLAEIRGAGTDRLRSIVEMVAGIHGIRDARVYLVLDAQEPAHDGPARETRLR